MNTLFIFCLISFTLSIDYSLGLISTQAYWINLGGDKKLSGLVFGIYDASTIVLTPLFAWLINTDKITYKKMFIISIITNIIGNVIYSTAYSANAWVMILIGRGIAGMGASVLPLQMVYVAQKMEISEQQNAVGYIKYISALSRVAGPVLGSIFSAKIDGGDIINMYTLVGWIPTIMGVITLLLLTKWKEAVSESCSDTFASARDIIGIFWPALLVGFVTTFIYWFFMGNLFAIATHHFHVISSEHELGNLNYAGIIGFVASFIIFMVFKKTMSNIKGLWIAIVLLSSSLYIYLPDRNFMFYIAVGSTTFAYGMTIPAINILNNILAKNSKHLLGKTIGLCVTLLSVIQSLARFIGPTSFSLTTAAIEKHDCNFTDEDAYIITGCQFDWYTVSAITHIIVSVLLMVAGTHMLSKKLDATKEMYASLIQV